MTAIKQKTAISCCHSVSAPAKINLFLSVKDRRSDGYHDIETIFLPLSRLADKITVGRRPKTGIELRCRPATVPDDQRNLCFQAAISFAQATGVEPGWKIIIDKKIPVAAGLGGGSSDAAATLRLLNGLEQPKLSNGELRELARRLGADVPFFLAPQPSLAGGIGDRLEPLALNTEIPLVLLNPAGCPLSATWAYSAVAGDYDRLSSISLQAAMREGDLHKIAGSSCNYFDRAVRKKIPLTAMFLEFLQKNHCLAAHVTGSGPTVYGICRTVEHAADTVAAARREFGRVGWSWSDLIEKHTLRS